MKTERFRFNLSLSMTTRGPKLCWTATFTLNLGKRWETLPCCVSSITALLISWSSSSVKSLKSGDPLPQDSSLRTTRVVNTTRSRKPRPSSITKRFSWPRLSSRINNLCRPRPSSQTLSSQPRLSGTRSPICPLRQRQPTAKPTRMPSPSQTKRHRARPRRTSCINTNLLSWTN
jgi:hypothetical protein